MKKKIAAILSAIMVVSAAAPAYGAEFTSGPQEGAVNQAAEEVFFGTEDTAEPVDVLQPEVAGAGEVSPSEDGDVFFEEPQEEPDIDSGETENHEPEVNEPEINEPEISEPEINDPEISDPEINEAEISDTEIFTGAEDLLSDASEGTEGEILSAADFTYQINNGEVTIVKELGEQPTLEIPESIDGHPVTAIGDKAFYESKKTEIRLPAGLRKIGAEAFAGCATLTRLEIPKSVEEIGENAFASCTQLVLVCAAESYAQKYAQEKQLPYELAEEEKADISKCTVKIASSAVCTGKALMPSVEVKDGEKLLVSGTDYTVEYRDNINPGKGTAVITGTGSYQGTLEKTFKITLAVPKLVSAKSASYSSVKVTWKAVPGAKTYIVYYKGNTVKSWKALKTGVKGTSYTHSKLVTGKKYTYTVKAVCDEVKSKCDSKGKSAVPSLATLKLGTVKSAGYNKLKISWKKVTGASGYYIYRKSGKSWKRIATAKASATSYTHTGSTKYPVKTGTTYTYSVKAYRKTGKTVALSKVNKSAGIKGKAIPAKPVLVNVECVGNGKITIRWKKAAGATAYLIYRKDDKGKWKQVTKINGSNMIGWTHSSSKDFPIVIGKTYTYTVRSYTDNGKTYGSYDTKGRTVKAISATAVAEAQALKNAQNIIAKITTANMTSSQKLKACFDWVISKPYVTRRKFVNTPGWPAVYANDHFVLGGGNCHSDACAFAYMAKALGYKNVYVCTDSDGTWGTAHGWAEVNGLVYDPLFAEAKGYYRYFGVSYGTYELSPILHIAI